MSALTLCSSTGTALAGDDAEISPDYLNRMVFYADTLLFLDPGETVAPVKRKKAPSAKAAKPTRTIKK